MAEAAITLASRDGVAPDGAVVEALRHGEAEATCRADQA